MENKQKLQELLLEEQADLVATVKVILPSFEAGIELGELIKDDENLSDSQTFLNVKKYGTNTANYLRSAKRSAEKAMRAIDGALARLGK